MAAGAGIAADKREGGWRKQEEGAVECFLLSNRQDRPPAKTMTATLAAATKTQAFDRGPAPSLRVSCGDGLGSGAVHFLDL
jgi:hypothetical protein